MSAFGPAENCPDCNGLYQQLEEQGRVLAERTAQRDALAAKVEAMIAESARLADECATLLERTQREEWAAGSVTSDRDFMLKYLGDLLRDHGIEPHANIAERLRQVSGLARRKPDFTEAPR